MSISVQMFEVNDLRLDLSSLPSVLDTGTNQVRLREYGNKHEK